MKRLLCIISSLNTGGAETFLMKMYRALPPEEYQLDFIVSENDGFYTQEVLDRGGRIFFVPTRTKHPIAAFRQIGKIVKENGYQHVLKLGDSPLQVVDLLATKTGGAKHLVLRSCNAPTHLSAKRKAIDAFFRPILNRTATVKIAPSDLAAAYTFGQTAYDRGEVTLLNNGVDLNVFRFDPEARQAIRAEFGLEDKLVVGHIGRFNQQKNHMFLLDIFNEIRKRNENAVLLLVGKGELEADIRRKIDCLGIADKVIFTGVRSDVPALLSAMDVFVFPSFFEGMPNTVIEAQATGLPCVIADTITKTADITGLVEYQSLKTSSEQWANRVLAKATTERENTTQAFIDHGYNIESVAKIFVTLCFGQQTNGEYYET